MLIVHEIVLVNTPARELVGFEPFKTLSLLLLGYVQEQLDDKIAVIVKLAFHCVDVGDAAFILMFVDTAVHIRFGGVAEPASVEYKKLALLRELHPVTVHPGLALFLLIRDTDRLDIVKAGIHILYQLRDL